MDVEEEDDDDEEEEEAAEKEEAEKKKEEEKEEKEDGRCNAMHATRRAHEHGGDDNVGVRSFRVHSY